MKERRKNNCPAIPKIHYINGSSNKIICKQTHLTWLDDDQSFCASTRYGEICGVVRWVTHYFTCALIYRERTHLCMAKKFHITPEHTRMAQIATYYRTDLISNQPQTTYNRPELYGRTHTHAQTSQPLLKYIWMLCLLHIVAISLCIMESIWFTFCPARQSSLWFLIYAEQPNRTKAKVILNWGGCVATNVMAARLKVELRHS